MDFNTMISQTTGGFGGQTPAINYKNTTAGFEFDKKGRIKKDPSTGLLIDPRDRRTLKQYNRNPFGQTVGNTLNWNIPNVLTGANIPSGGYAGILSGLQGLGQ
jgi:hypothetical protein